MEIKIKFIKLYKTLQNLKTKIMTYTANELGELERDPQKPKFNWLKLTFEILKLLAAALAGNQLTHL